MNIDDVELAAQSPFTPAPSECCETEGAVIACDNEVDVVECWVCGARWTEACEGRAEA